MLGYGEAEAEEGVQEEGVEECARCWSRCTPLLLVEVYTSVLVAGLQESLH